MSIDEPLWIGWPLTNVEYVLRVDGSNEDLIELDYLGRTHHSSAEFEFSLLQKSDRRVNSGFVALFKAVKYGRAMHVVFQKIVEVAMETRINAAFRGESRMLQVSALPADILVD